MRTAKYMTFIIAIRRHNPIGAAVSPCRSAPAVC